MVKEKEWFKAIRGGHVQVIINLLNAMKDRRPGRLKNLVKQLHSVDGTQSTALHLSCQYDHWELVSILLQNGASPNIADESGCTALHMAAWSGNEKICHIIMDNSQVPVELNARNSSGETALHLASQHGHEKVVESLLSFGADPLVTNNQRVTALSLACQFGRCAVVQALLQRLSREAKMVKEYETCAESALHIAAHNGHAQVVDLLLKNGFYVNAKTKDGATCLHDAVTWNRVPVVEVLLKHNIDTEAQNGDGKTALDLLANNNQEFGLKMRKMIKDHSEKAEQEGADSLISTTQKKDQMTEEDGETSAILGIGAILTQSDDAPSSRSPRPVRPSTPEQMRLLSSKYRDQFQRICSNDQDDDLVTNSSDDEKDSDVFH